MALTVPWRRTSNQQDDGNKAWACIMVRGHVRLVWVKRSLGARLCLPVASLERRETNYQLHRGCVVRAMHNNGRNQAYCFIKGDFELDS